jgi:dCMP deaminase
MKWERRFLRLAEHIADWSKDPSTRVGCVVVGPDREIRSTGFNGFPRGIADTAERLSNRDLKYPLICHAEENAIMHAARIGISLRGCSAYVTWPPCTRCARSLVQAGISRVLYPAGLAIPERWREDFELSNELLSEARVEVQAIAMTDAD